MLKSSQGIYNRSNSVVQYDDDDPVKLILKNCVGSSPEIYIRDNDRYGYILFEKLKTKMRSKWKKGFAVHSCRLRAILGKHDDHHTTMTNIELVNAPLSQPFDVKISYNHEYIICTDCGDPGRILFFDLNSKQFQFSIPTPSYGPMFLCIEEGYRNAFSDALFFDCKGDKSLHKYDLQSFVFNKQRDQEYSDCDEESPLQGKIWTSVCVQGATGISIMQSQSKLFVGCFDRTVKILDSNTGTLIDVVALMNTLPLGINFFEMGKNHYLIVGGWKKIEFFVKQVDVCQETWSCLQNNAGLIHSSGSNTYGTVFDPISRCLIVPTQDTVVCYRLFESTHLEWTLINKVDVHNFARPQGLCLNDRSGELLVCERGANRIRIYQ